MPDKKDENVIASRFKESGDVREKFVDALQLAEKELGFTPIEEPQLTGYWLTDTWGAANVRGQAKLDGKKVSVRLKIQGPEMKTTEAEMIEEFAKQNTGKIVEPPKIYGHIPWSWQNGFELVLMEDVIGFHPIHSKPPSERELDNFFLCLEDFSEANQKMVPWIKRPTEPSYVEKYQSSLENYSHRPNKNPIAEEDYEMAWQATRLLDRVYSGMDDPLEFTHKHFEPGSILIREGSDPVKAVLFANLFWGWAPKFYSLVFAYYWHMLGMEHAENLTIKMLEKERELWLTRIHNLPIVKNTPDGEKLLNLALLGRAGAALTLDIHLLGVSSEHTKIVYEGAKSDLSRLLTICRSYI